MYKILITINCISIAKIHRKLTVCSLSMTWTSTFQIYASSMLANTHIYI